MEIAVLSDIHGNYAALEEVERFASARQIHTFIFLGDYVGELAYPQKTMNLIYDMQSKYQCYYVKGNKEDYWINYKEGGGQGWRAGDSTTGSLLYTYNNLTDKDIRFFQSMPHSADLSLDTMEPITICHGSPNRVNEKMLPGNEKTFQIMEQSQADIILCGHTHIQGTIAHNGKRVLNPGAVGMSLHSGGKAQFMILHGENDRWNEEFISLDYDVQGTIADMFQSGLNEFAPWWCEVTKHLLCTGEISQGSVLAKAMKYCEEDLGKCIWPGIPEKYWEKAVKEMLGI